MTHSKLGRFPRGSAARLIHDGPWKGLIGRHFQVLHSHLLIVIVGPEQYLGRALNVVLVVVTTASSIQLLHINNQRCGRFIIVCRRCIRHYSICQLLLSFLRVVDDCGLASSCTCLLPPPYSSTAVSTSSLSTPSWLLSLLSSHRILLDIASVALPPPSKRPIGWKRHHRR